MELKDILAISGQPGLYKYVAQSTRGVIVESLLDGKRSNASASSRVSALTEISMFTEGDDIPLAEVFTRIYAHTGGKQAISHRESPEALKAFFAEVLPEYDRERCTSPTSRSASRGTTFWLAPASRSSSSPSRRTAKSRSRADVSLQRAPAPHGAGLFCCTGRTAGVRRRYVCMNFALRRSTKPRDCLSLQMVRCRAGAVARVRLSVDRTN